MLGAFTATTTNTMKHWEEAAHHEIFGTKISTFSPIQMLGCGMQMDSMDTENTQIIKNTKP